jgi:hypothetical protein
VQGYHKGDSDLLKLGQSLGAAAFNESSKMTWATSYLYGEQRAQEWFAQLHDLLAGEWPPQ